ncbi:branched-chain amino acid ABC transporter substrate-binding protein [Streptomyces spiramenti]|uniref:Branched-chain amino acid ABC transporter substrate-binding protein n=1 Tax=Streptomyces spiramenti TaxID=2720606 RepID=A0ABX1ALL2_9ACTN|nr:branched-chain amino acid ABC transporter substrate-binding protein [Streptomyces spiramenti]NJP66546.1 branched-chain amino acid ABC transporter substrate-binding protein [Streptomyces spiramenti]
MLNKRIVKIALPVAIGALALSACGSDDSGGGSSGGGGGDGSGFTIAYQGPLSGPNAQLGINMENGVKLAIKEANESGDYDVTFEYASGDDRGEPGQAASAAQRIIDNDDVIAVVGPAFSGAANVAAPSYGEAGITALSPSATAPDLTEQGFPTFLRGVPNDGEQGAAIASFFAEQGVESAVVIDDLGDYAVGLGNVVEEALGEAGIEVQRESLPADTVDHSSIARTVIQSGADAVAYTGYYAQAAPLAVKLSEQGYEGIGLGGDGVRDPEFVNLASGAAEGWYLSCPCRDLNEDEIGQKFSEAYEAEYSTAPGTYSPEAYDATMMIINAVNELGDSADRASVYDAIAQGEHDGVAKTLTFDETGEYAGSGIYIYEVKDDEIVSLGNVEELVG